MVPLMLLASGLADFLPTGPVVIDGARRSFDRPVPAAVAYTGPPRVPFPVLPVQVWGLRYDLDLVIETRDPHWTMHEYSRIDTGARRFWIAKDADHCGVQTITTSEPGERSWLPEIPAPRVHGEVIVTPPDWNGVGPLEIAYRSPGLNQPMVASWEGPLPVQPQAKRNGNTMGHSRQALAALLDIHRFRLFGAGGLSIDGRASPVRRLLGLLPVRFLIAQTQGGFARTDFFQSAGSEPDTFQLRRPGVSTVDWPTEATEAWQVSDGWARRPVRTPEDLVGLSYHFTEGGLDRAVAWQVGMDVPATEVLFQPALPDVRRPFAGVATSRFVVDMAGQEGHGTGTIEARWSDAEHVVLALRPTAPAWFAARPMEMVLTYSEAGVRVTGRMTAPADCPPG